ncbi:MAG TPA: RecQ family ATP-dependent DNA helicase [Blastocatellia bacterium]|nr:RecQ family ATP-dependent DNA helicase [Blastocatellia bacterium]
MAKADRPKGEALLRKIYGNDASFREGQWEAIREVASERGRLLVVQRTGWGKSLVYLLSTRLLRDDGGGPTLLISPLRALMRNQLDMARGLSLNAAIINSDNTEQWDAVESELQRDLCDILLIAPERLNNERFLTRVLNRISGRIGLFVVDEAHCISDWGHDFRPDYRRIVRVLQLLPPNVPVLCTTATANTRVIDDIVAQIGSGLKVQRGPLTRASLRLFNIALSDQSERLAWLAQCLPKLEGSGIVYCLTVNDVRRVASWLVENGIDARPYYADLTNEERTANEEALLSNQIKVLVATTALGMGYDKPDLGFVIHFQRPGSVIAYYQQVGRAGRAVDNAFGILLSGREDDEIQDYFIRSAFPPDRAMREVIELLGSADGLTVNEIANKLNFAWGTIEKALKLLELDDAVVRRERRYFATANRWSPDPLHAEEVTRQRLRELEEMRRYVMHDGCLMEFLARALDDPSAARCGRCMNCVKKQPKKSVDESLHQRAYEFLRSASLVIEPRRQWPSGASQLLSGRIPEAVRACPGRVLSIYGDAGWGREVARCKYQVGEFSEPLVTASVELISARWKPDPPPSWVAAVPSLRDPRLVYTFARRVAERLGLPFADVLRKKTERPEQKTMENSAQQLRNLIDAFEIAARVPDGPVLLIDDVIDSRWTITVVAWLLRKNGSGPVHPFALASAAAGGS